ncbi:acyltransferase [Trujillonella humicola]|uniref:acyltransferase n=1 Tax=Trujillonella humicola TaxID=3383699 RepID=UPI0039061970
MGVLAEIREGAFRSVVNGVLAHPLVPFSQRWRLLRACGFPFEPALIGSGVWFGGRDVTIGRGSGVNMGVVFDSMAPITLGEQVYVGHQVLILTSTHEKGTNGRAAGKAVGKPVTIEDGAWIGARSVILPGVTIGAGCTVAAGSIVRRNCVPGGLYAGNPARLVRGPQPDRSATEDVTAA